MTDMKFVDTAELTGVRETSDGYLVADVRCARTGCQQYHGSEIGLVDAGAVNVYRPEEVVFAKDSLATFAHKPVTVNHPPVPVMADNWKEYAVGDIGDEIARDGDFVRVSIKIMDAEAIKVVKDGTREISMGYSTGLEFRDGVAPDGTSYQAVQTGPIKINHLALVPKARGGENLRVGDGAVDKWGVKPYFTLSDKTKEDTHMSDALKTVVLGDTAVNVAADAVATIELFKADAAKQLADQAASHTLVVEAKDEEIGALKATVKKLEDNAMTPEKVTKLVADRVALETAVKMIDDSIVVDGVIDADLRKAAVAAKLGDEMVADASEGEITGMFKAICKDAKNVDTFADSASKKANPATPNTGEVVTADQAYQANVQHLSDAWKNTA